MSGLRRWPEGRFPAGGIIRRKTLTSNDVTNQSVRSPNDSSGRTALSVSAVYDAATHNSCEVVS
ncbi:MAG: hypothetical protein DWH91_10520 [Planctomycetota bacterium]|nr:MAG: hypothetical protein DWH91_10520 [Planctomycetota bacterium]